MTHQRRTALINGVFATLPLCLVMLAAGCSKSQETAGAPPMAGAPGGPPPGPGGPMGKPVAADASGADIFQQMCQGCHGNTGQGARGPSLKSATGDPVEKLAAFISHGSDRMPAFKSRLTPEQINKVAAYVKTLKPA